MVVGPAGIQDDGPADQFHGPVVTALLVCHDAEQMNGLGVIGVAGQDGLG